MFVLLIGQVLCEIFLFRQPNETMELMFRLDSDNINTGLFRIEPGHNMKFDVSITSKDEKKTLYSNDSLEEGVETHFSFSNTDISEVVLRISSRLIDSSEPFTPGEIQMKFESAIDTFNSKVSKKFQYEPAIFALDHLLKKLNDIIHTTKNVYNHSGDLGKEQKKMLSFVTGFSILSLMAYAAFNLFQLYLMKSYLNEKKYL